MNIKWECYVLQVVPVIEAKRIKYKNDIHSDGNLLFLSVPYLKFSLVMLSWA